MNLSTADSLLLQRYLDGELDTAAAAAWRARVDGEPALQQALAAQQALRGAFRAARGDSSRPPAGFAQRVLAGVRQLPARAELEAAAAAGTVQRLCRWVLLVAAVLFCAGLAMRAGWLQTGFGAGLQAAPDEVADELQRLDQKARERLGVPAGRVEPR
jgi:anti-sigma factor RsiW